MRSAPGWPSPASSISTMSAKRPKEKLVFITDKEKAALNGVTTETDRRHARRAARRQGGGGGPQPERAESRSGSSSACRSTGGRARRPWPRCTSRAARANSMPLAELGQWKTTRVDQMIYLKTSSGWPTCLPETAVAPPADVVVDILADRRAAPRWQKRRGEVGNGWMSTAEAVLAGRTFFQWQRHRLGGAGGFHRGFCRRGENGRSRSTCSAISAWLSGRR